MADLLLGFDLGTTSVKAGVFDPNGACVAEFSESYPSRRHGGGICEQDPADWTRLLDAALARFAAQGLSGRVAAGALTSQVNTHVFVDASGDPLMPAITWQDTRAAAEAAELDAALSIADKMAWLGAPIPIDASHPLARMLWVSRHCPQIWDRTATVLLPKDLALAHLTGQTVTDPLSNIGLAGVDGAYVPQLLGLVPGAADRMAPLAGLTEIVGTLRGPDLPGIPMATATMDGWVGVLGAGACRAGAGAYLSGTSEILGLASDVVTNTPGVVVFAPAEGVRLHVGPTQSGGASQQWFCDLTGLTIPQMAALVASSARRFPTPLFLPQLSGERAPLWNAELRGAFLAVDGAMGTADFARSVYEGVALSARHIWAALETSAALSVDSLSCGGGGFRSEPWGQVRADVLGKQLRRLQHGACGVVGAACIAAVAAGLYGTLAEAHQPFRIFDRTWDPAPGLRGFYDDLFGLYTRAIAANEDLGKQLSRLSPGTGVAEIPA